MSNSTRWHQLYDEAVDDGVPPEEARELANATVAEERFALIKSQVGLYFDPTRGRNIPLALVGVPVPTGPGSGPLRARQERLLAEYDRAVNALSEGG